MPAIDWTQLFKNYKGLWVALAQDEITVLASAKTAKEAWSRAKKDGYDRPILHLVPDKMVTYVGTGITNEVQEV